MTESKMERNEEDLMKMIISTIKFKSMVNYNQNYIEESFHYI